MSGDGSGPFGARAVRIWSVLGGMAGVGALVWAVVFATDVRSPVDQSTFSTPTKSSTPAKSSTPTETSTPTVMTTSSASSTLSQSVTTPPPSVPPTTAVPPTRPVWIAQLASVEVSDAARLSTVLAAVRRDVPRANVLLSSDYASLRPGYWIVYYVGGFSDGHDALAYCATHGRRGSDLCIGRLLSHDPADFGYQCYPADSTKPSRCEKD